ncbi:MAG: hypothetical protein EA366_01750 [Spirulina sp. DLM2.Bin59]|nr:MAG: hypothetical protein EA366_01750 [Spirulina sp. DLM2.Bin59]
MKQAFTAVENRLPALAGLVSRGFVPGAPSAANSVTEINNIAVRILTQPATVTQPEAKTDLFANLKARLRGNAS